MCKLNNYATMGHMRICKILQTRKKGFLFVMLVAFSLVSCGGDSRHPSTEELYEDEINATVSLPAYQVTGTSSSPVTDSPLWSVVSLLQEPPPFPTTTTTVREETYRSAVFASELDSLFSGTVTLSGSFSGKTYVNHRSMKSDESRAERSDDFSCLIRGKEGFQELDGRCTLRMGMQGIVEFDGTPIVSEIKEDDWDSLSLRERRFLVVAEALYGNLEGGSRSGFQVIKDTIDGEPLASGMVVGVSYRLLSWDGNRERERSIIAVNYTKEERSHDILIDRSGIDGATVVSYVIDHVKYGE